LIIIAQKGCTCNSKVSGGSDSSCLGYGFGFNLGSDLGIDGGLLLCTLDSRFIVFLGNFLSLLFNYLLVVYDLIFFNVLTKLMGDLLMLTVLTVPTDRMVLLLLMLFVLIVI
jgi:hypothetical protein